MTIEVAMETVPVVTPKALISGPPALSDIFSASEDEQEKEGRDEELLDNSEDFLAKRQAPPTNASVPVGAAPSEWSCMHGLFPLLDGSDDFYSWCKYPFFPTPAEESTSVPLPLCQPSGKSSRT